MNSPKTRCTNFAGSWDDICPHCGFTQLTHRRVLGEFDGEITSPIVGALAFGLSLVKLGFEFVKFFGNPDKWIPGHKERAEKQRRNDHR